MIEKDLKSIKASHRKTSKTLKDIQSWQIQHQKLDDGVASEVSEIKEFIKKLPTTDDIKDVVQVTVNGKVDKANKSIEAVLEHLKEQDKAIQEVSAKIKPLDGARNWIMTLVKVILGIGGICVAIAGIMELLSLWIQH